MPEERPAEPVVEPPNRQSIVVVPGVSPDVFPRDKHPLPPVLNKYLRPERRVDLTQCLIRFSQRQVFEDGFDLRPEVTRFGTESEIMAFFESDPELRRQPPELRKLVARHVLTTPGREASLIANAQATMTAPEGFAVLCLSEDPLCGQMWEQYADGGRWLRRRLRYQKCNFRIAPETGKDRQGRVH